MPSSDNNNNKCTRCQKTVYFADDLRLLDQTWHKSCFKCEECAMLLTVKTFKTFNKKPYCSAHCPKLQATAVADTPESRRLASLARVHSGVKHRDDFPKLKGIRASSVVADDLEFPMESCRQTAEPETAEVETSKGFSRLRSTSLVSDKSDPCAVKVAENGFQADVNNDAAETPLPLPDEELPSVRKDFESFKAKILEDNESLKLTNSEQFSTLKEEIENLKASMAEKGGEVTKLNLHIDTLHQENNYSKTQVIQLSEEMTKQSEQLAHQQREIQSLKVMKSEAPDEELASARKDFESFKAKCIEDNESLKSQMTGELAKHSEQITTLKEEIENLKAVIVKTTSDLSKSNLEIATLRQEIDKLKAQNLHLTEEMAKQNEQLANQQAAKESSKATKVMECGNSSNRTGSSLIPFVKSETSQVNRKPTASTLSQQIPSTSLYIKEIRSHASAPSSREKSSPSAFLEEITHWDWFKAVMKGDVQKVKDFVDRGFNCNTKNEDHDGLTALHYCAKNDSRKHLDMARLLLEHGADVNAIDKDKETPLIAACCPGKLEVCQLLIKHGADVNATDGWQNTPLIWAAEAGEEEIVTILAEHPQFNSLNHTNNCGKTALKKAFIRGHVKVVDILKSKGAINKI